MENKEVINSDKEFLNWIYERMICVHGEKDLCDYMINFKAIINRIDRASGSVAAPKEEEALEEIIKGVVGIKPGAGPLTPMDYEECKECMIQYATSLRQQLETLRGFVKEVDASLYHGPDLEDKEIMQHYIEVFKIIKEEARKLISK